MPDTGLLVEVPAVEPLVESWRSRYDPAAAKGVPAHITVLFPFVAPDDLDATVVECIGRAVREVPPFEFELVAVDEFPDAVWLRPEPRDGFVALTNALWAEFPQYPPYGGRFPDVRPHLTIAKVLSDDARRDLRVDIEAAFNGSLPLGARAEALSVFTSDDRGIWTRRHILPLRGVSDHGL
jgi:2'-5' RNA ligase